MNLVLIALDTLRADHLGCYGYRRDTSPFLDAFARQSVLFERYFATTIPTHPSFTTLFTGMDAFGHQVTNVAGEHEPSKDIPVMAEVLRDAGFQTAAVDTMGRWMNRGFDVYENPGYSFFKG
jgi:arylsulfatase A-like enzyme